MLYFDGQHWHQLTGLQADSLAIDVNGDLWLMQDDYRLGGTTVIHFSGHIPPGDQPWPYERYAPDQQPPWLSWDMADCNAWVASHVHHTRSECQAWQATHRVTFLSNPNLSYLIAIDRDDSVWVNTGHALYHHSENPPSDQKLSSTHIESTTSHDLPVTQGTSLVPDPEHGVWLGTDRGLLYSDGLTLRLLPLDQDQSTLHAQPRNIAVDTQSNAWIVTAQGVQMLPASGTQWQDVTDFDLGPSVNHWPLGTIATAQEGGIWATHGGDLWRFGGSMTTPLTNSVPLGEGCRLIHLTVDRDGNVWSPLGKCGVTVFIPKIGDWVLYPFEGLGVEEVFIGGDGTVYAHNDAGQLYRLTNLDRSSGALSHAWEIVDPTQPIQQASFGADAQGGLWTVDCPTGEVQRKQGGSVTTFGKVFTGAKSFSCSPANRWYFDARSGLWVYDYAGRDLLRYDGQAWQSAHQPNVGPIQDITTGPDGRVWFVGDRGVAVYDPKLDKQP